MSEKFMTIDLSPMPCIRCRVAFCDTTRRVFIVTARLRIETVPEASARAC